MSVIIVSGPPFAGKSTFIKKHFPERTVVDIYTFQQNRLIEPETIMDTYEDCKCALQQAIREGKSVVLEHPLLCQKRRPMYINAIREVTDEDIEMYFILPSKKEHLRRARQRMKNCPAAYIHYVNELAEVPHEDEGYSKICIIRDTSPT
jgi:predicted kinase